LSRSWFESTGTTSGSSLGRVNKARKRTASERRLISCGERERESNQDEHNSAGALTPVWCTHLLRSLLVTSSSLSSLQETLSVSSTEHSGQRSEQLQSCRIEFHVHVRNENLKTKPRSSPAI
jgi:cytochrome b